MKKIIAIQSNNLKTINPLTDTSLQLAIEAQKRGFKVFWYEADSQNLEDLLKNISNLSDDNVNISIYSKSGAFE